MKKIWGKNQQIIAGIIAGDRVVIKSFYKRNLPYVRHYLKQYQGSTEDVQDIFQEAMILLSRKLKIDQLEIQQSIHNYFIGICKNLWKNQLRRKHFLEYQEQLNDTIDDTSISAWDVIEQKQQQAVLHKHMSRLNDGNRQLIELFIAGNSMKTIANVLGYTEGYTRKKKFKIKENLQRMVQSDPIYMELVC